jgi:hypothetical protein
MLEELWAIRKLIYWRVGRMSMNFHLFLRSTLVHVFVCFSLLGCGSDNSQESSPLEQNAVRALLLTQANAVSFAVSALDSLSRWDTETAKSTLEAQVRSELTKMYVLRPDLKDGDRATIDEAMRQAEEYARGHNLRVEKPAQ